jgi:hypothetical protein
MLLIVLLYNASRYPLPYATARMTSAGSKKLAPRISTIVLLLLCSKKCRSAVHAGHSAAALQMTSWSSASPTVGRCSK